jgi:hypothetical protein
MPYRRDIFNERAGEIEEELGAFEHSKSGPQLLCFGGVLDHREKYLISLAGSD